jgi:hypothetical protein
MRFVLVSVTSLFRYAWLERGTHLYARYGAFNEPLQKRLPIHTLDRHMIRVSSGLPTRRNRHAHKTRDFSSLHTHTKPRPIKSSIYDARTSLHTHGEESGRWNRTK